MKQTNGNCYLSNGKFIFVLSDKVRRGYFLSGKGGTKVYLYYNPLGYRLGNKLTFKISR